MRPRRRGSPAEWMYRANSDLALARSPVRECIALEDLCFHAQQAVEKSIKGVLVSRVVLFPKTHNLDVLLNLLPSGIPIPPEDEQVRRLTEYAVVSRYPGMDEPVTEEEYREAVRLAEAVVKWAEDILKEADAL